VTLDEASIAAILYLARCIFTFWKVWSFL